MVVIEKLTGILFLTALLPGGGKFFLKKLPKAHNLRKPGQFFQIEESSVPEREKGSLETLPTCSSCRVPLPNAPLLDIRFHLVDLRE